MFIIQRNKDNDEQAGLTAADEEIGDWLRKNYSNKYVILAVNKCESPRKGLMQASEFWSLGWGVSYYLLLSSSYFQVFDTHSSCVSVNNVDFCLNINFI